MFRFLFLILLLPSVCFAAPQSGMMQMMSLMAGGPASSEDSCTSGLIDSWHMENIDLASEAGCSTLGDTTWAANSTATLSSTDKSEGTYSGYGANNLDYHTKDITQNAPTSEGTAWIDVRIVTYANNAIFWTLKYDASNYVDLAITNGTGTIDIRSRYTGNATVSTAIANTNIDEAQNKWYRIKYQWKVSATTADQRIDVWELDSSNPRVTTGSPVTQGPEDDITAMTSAPTVEQIGMTIDAAGAIYYDNYKLYDTSEL